MKIEFSIEMGDHGKGMEKKPMALTPFQKKVAAMLAKEKGKKKPDESDFDKARDLEEDD